MKTIKVNAPKEYHKGLKKQMRESNGRFIRKTTIALFCLFIITAIFAIAYLSQNINLKTEYVEKVVVIDTTKEIVSKEKTEILNVLEDCESKGDENAIVWEDNGAGKNRASFGAYMFKVGTVQQFIKGLTDFQAIQLASNRAESRKLAEMIIFETNGGIYNWKNCMNKHNLLERVKFVKELEGKIK